MITGPYGRQWISPRASEAFSIQLLQADSYCIRGDVYKSLRIYKAEARQSRLARRRLAIAQKQLRKTLLSKNKIVSSELRLGFIDWYPNFEKDIKSILSLFLGAGLNVKLCEVEDADILVAGSYGNELFNNLALSEDKLVILLTGENICPSYDIHYFSITTRSRSDCRTTIRLSQWLGELCLRNGNIYLINSKDYRYEVSKARDLAISANYKKSTPER